MSDYMLLEDVETEWPGFKGANVIDWQNRVYEVLIDPDSAEADAAQAQLFGALHDDNSAWHTQAIQVLRQLYEHFANTTNAELESLDAEWVAGVGAARDEADYFAHGW